MPIYEWVFLVMWLGGVAGALASRFGFRKDAVTAGCWVVGAIGLAGFALSAVVNS